MKPCRQNKKLITWFILNELGPREISELTTHLRHCKGCQVYLKEMRCVANQLNALRSVAETEAGVAVCAEPLPRRSPASLSGQVPSWWAWPIWRFALPGFAILALTLLVVSTLQRTPVDQTTRVVSPVVAVAPALGEPLPTLSNYRAVANESLDKLDQLLTRQAEEPVSNLPPLSRATLALINMPD